MIELLASASALPMLVVGASGVLAGSALGGWVGRRMAGVSGHPPRMPERPDESARPAPERPAGPVSPGSGVPDDPGRTVEGDRPSPCDDRESARAARRSDGPVVTPEPRVDPGPACIAMSARQQVAELIQWMVHWEYVGTFPFSEVLKFYAAWAREKRVITMPDAEILTLLAQHPCVVRRRDRVKCPVTGKVRKNAAGTPERITTYTVATRAVVVPGGVSAGAPVPAMRRAA